MAYETYALTPLITLTMAIPLATAGLLALIPREHHAAHKWLAFIGSLFAFLCALSVWVNFDPARAGLQVVEDYPWLPFGARYTVGVDGISLLLFMLTTFLTPVAILGAFRAIASKGFYIAMLLLEVAMVGTFVALDLLLFYLFWEFMLVPMYLIIGVFGGERRVYAAVKFFLFTFFGSVLMLVGVIWLYLKTGSFALSDLYKLRLAYPEQLYLFAGFGLAFAIKVPLFPFHTWLPDAHVEAPTAGSVILAGILLKMGVYGFIRLAIPLFPDAAHTFALPVMALAVVGIVYGSLCAFAQEDAKKLVAYSSVAHLGFVMLGLFAMAEEAVQGAVLQMVNHGISTGALFVLVGVLYERRHTRAIDAYGGIARPMKVFAALFVVVTLSSIGLPGTNGFVGEFLILAGTFRQALSRGLDMHALALGIVAATGVLLSAIYMLNLVRRLLFGPIVHEENRNLKDLSFREVMVLMSLVALVFWIGIYPSSFLSRSEATVKAFVETYKARVHMSDIPRQAIWAEGGEGR